MKKFITAALIIALSFNLCFANGANWGRQVTPEYSPARSKARVWMGALLILAGGYLAIDGFSQVNADVTDASFILSGMDIFSNLNPIHAGQVGFGAYWVQQTVVEPFVYELNSAGTIKNVGNTDIRNLQIHISYKLSDASFTPSTLASVSNALNIGNTSSWTNADSYETSGTNSPNGLASDDTAQNAVFNQYAGRVGSTFTDRTADGLLMIYVTGDYDTIYRKKTKNPFQGYTGVALALTGGYLIVDYIVSLRKVNQYMLRNDLDFRFAQTPDQVSMLLSKRL